MQVFVINLDSDRERLAHVTAQLIAAGLSFERMPGVYGKALTPSQRKLHYDDGKAKWRQSRALSPAEVGCSLSHLKIYREIVRRGLPFALVLEDDVVLDVAINSVLLSLEDFLDPDEPSLVLLSPAETHNEFGEPLIGGLRLKTFKAGYYGSSYIVTRRAAEVLLAELYPVGEIPDPWMRLTRYGLIKISAVTPALTRQEQETFGSSTTEGIKKVLGDSIFAVPLYKARRVRAVLWDAVMPTLRGKRPARISSGPHPIDNLFS